MVEAESSEAGFAAEGEEVKLVAVGVLAVGADEGWVGCVHCCVGVVRWGFRVGHGGGGGSRFNIYAGGAKA